MYDFWLVRKILGGSYVESRDGVWFKVVRIGIEPEEMADTPYGLISVKNPYFIRRHDA